MGLFLTDANCKKQREYVGIPAFQSKGYLGEGLVILHDDLEENSSHSECCVDIIQTILPKAKVIPVVITYTSDSKSIDCRIKYKNIYYDAEQFIKDNKVNMINNSTASRSPNSNLVFDNYWNDLIVRYNLICTCSAGNASDSMNKFSKSFIPVGGIFFKGNTMEIYPAYDDGLFVMFMGFQSGTSFSAPFLNGMLGLLRCERPNITQADAINVLKGWCKDLGIVGFDRQYGFGLPIMKIGDFVSKKKIAIDTGHGGTDSGATGGGMLEKKINYNVATKLKDLLLVAGFTVFMDRPNDETISLDVRSQLINKFNPDITVSIHHNAGGGYGYDLIYNVGKNEPASKKLANLIAPEFKSLGQTEHKIYNKTQSDGRDYYSIQRNTLSPTLICEFAFLDTLDVKDVDTLTEQWAEAKAISKGLINYFK